MAGYVLDTSAIIAYLYDEDGSDQAEAVIFGGGEVAVPFAAVMEVEYKLLRELPDDTEERMTAFLDWPVQVIESDSDWRHEAAVIKSRGRLSYADAWIASLALLRDAGLVHKDPEFDSIAELRAVRLPYRPRGRR